MSEDEQIYPEATRQIAEQRNRLAPGQPKSAERFSKSVFGGCDCCEDEAVDRGCSRACDCIRGHTRAALRHGATGEEIMEASWVAAEMRAGGAYAHSALALDTIAHIQAEKEP